MKRCKRCSKIIESFKEIEVDLWLGIGGDTVQILEGEYCSPECMKIELLLKVHNIPLDLLAYCSFVK